MEPELEKISQTTATVEETPESNVDSEEQRPRRQEPRTSKTYPEICIFCEKKTRYNIKGTETLDPLIQCVDLQADASVRKAVIATGDSRIIGLASHDLVAAEAWYHD